MAQAAKAAGIRHAIWSTFEDTRTWIPLDDDRMPTLQGRFKVAHFDGKAEANHFFTDAGVPTTFLLTSAYWENFIYFGWGPARGEDGVLAITYPMGDKKLPGIGVGGHRQVRLRDLQGGRHVHRQDGRRRRRAPDRRGDRRGVDEGSRRGSPLQRRPAGRLSAASASPAPTTSGTCSSSSATRTTTTAPRATWRSPARSTPRCRA